MNLFHKLGDGCVFCKKFRDQNLDIFMASLLNESLIVAPTFYYCQLDLIGPLKLYVPGHSMLLRNRKIQDCEVWVMVSVCLVTKAVNLQVIEGKSADTVINGVNRLGCEVGMPSLILIDQDSRIMKAFNEAQVNMKDIDFVLFRENKIRFRTCSVSGHNMNGLAERKIRSVSESLEAAGILKRTKSISFMFT